MSKKCFVIMPFGGGDEDRVRHYAGVYHSIIVPAATRAGYSVKRSDLAGEPGNITHDIIRDLAEADVVVADLTEGNANVFFELGIRHSFRKSGTVHIIDLSHGVPFDVGQYRAIKYSTDLADLPACIDEIERAIQKREAQAERSDNPVHDALPGLPLDIRSTGDSALQAQLLGLQETLSRVRTEKEQLEKKLFDLDPGGMLKDGAEEVDVEQLLNQADAAMKSTGAHVLLRLKEKAEEGGTDAFVKELRIVLKSPFLSSTDFSEIAKMCRILNLLEHRRATLELARARFPAVPQIFTALIDAYDDSPSPMMKERGRLMMEDYLKVTYTGEGPELPALPKDSNVLPLLFNVYFSTGHPDFVLSASKSAERLGLADNLLLRNKARALNELGRRDEAELEFKKALQLDPRDSATRVWYGDFLDDLGRFKEAYEETELGVVIGSDDGTRYVNLAIQIHNRGLVRGKSGEIIGPIPKDQRVRYTVPLLLRAVQESDHLPMLRARIVGLLVSINAITEAKAFEASKVPEGVYETSVIDYLDYLKDRSDPDRAESAETEPSKGPDAASPS